MRPERAREKAIEAAATQRAAAERADRVAGQVGRRLDAAG